MKRDKNFQSKVDETITQGEDGDKFLQLAHVQIQQNKKLSHEKFRIAEKSAVGTASQTGSFGEKTFNRKRILILLICALVVIAIVLSICLTVANGNKITYSYTGTRASSIEELNSISEIQFNDVEGLKVSCAYDGDYNVDLFYIVRYLNNDTYDDLTIVVETNGNFKYPFIDYETWEYTENLNGYTLNYCYQEIEALDDEINLVKISAKIAAAENLYITYEGLQTSGETNFIPLLNEIII